MSLAERISRRWNGLSRSARTVLSFILLLPLAELAFWGVVEGIGGRQGWGVVAGVAAAFTALSLAVSPKEALEDPEVGGKFAAEHPFLARVICVAGGVVCIGLAVASAFGRQLGLVKD